MRSFNLHLCSLHIFAVMLIQQEKAHEAICPYAVLAMLCNELIDCVTLSIISSSSSTTIVVVSSTDATSNITFTFFAVLTTNVIIILIIYIILSEARQYLFGYLTILAFASNVQRSMPHAMNYLPHSNLLLVSTRHFHLQEQVYSYSDVYLLFCYHGHYHDNQY